MDLDQEEETRLRTDARISNPLRKVPTYVEREKLLAVDALLENLDVLNMDQIALIVGIIKLRLDKASRIRASDAVNEQRRNNM
jgi:hypothetical protein